jgi:GNAT superfamily N-acetyltransferase
MPALHALFLAAIAAVYRPHGFEPPAPPLDVFAGQQRHILDSGGTALVALQGGEISGFASAWSRGADWFLASLFVAPPAQSAGVGRRLLDEVWGEGYERRRTITDAIQPVSNAIYGARGLTPATPILSFSGRPASGPAPLEEGSGELGPIDAAAYGFDRELDHGHWSRYARRAVWIRRGEAVAYSYAFPGGAIGPVGGVDAEAAAGALEGELSRADGPVTVRIPGSSRTLVATSLRRGLRLSPTPGLLLLSDEAVPPTSLAIASYTLF